VSVRLTINDQQFNQALKGATAEGLIRAGLYLHNRCRLAVNKSNPRNSETGQYDDPSSPGSPPKSRTGFGRDNVVFEFNDDTERPAVRVGVRQNAIYMYFLEIGVSPFVIKPSGDWLRIPWSGEIEKENRVLTRGPNKGKTKVFYFGVKGEKRIPLVKQGGEYVYFRKQINHPGIAPRPWLVKTLMDNKQAIGRLAAIGGASKIK
jgi:hypothetical protein